MREDLNYSCADLNFIEVAKFRLKVGTVITVS